MNYWGNLFSFTIGKQRYQYLFYYLQITIIIPLSERHPMKVLYFGFLYDIKYNIPI